MPIFTSTDLIHRASLLKTFSQTHGEQLAQTGMGVLKVLYHTSDLRQTETLCTGLYDALQIAPLQTALTARQEAHPMEALRQRWQQPLFSFRELANLITPAIKQRQDYLTAILSIMWVISLQATKRSTAADVPFKLQDDGKLFEFLHHYAQFATGNSVLTTTPNDFACRKEASLPIFAIDMRFQAGEALPLLPHQHTQIVFGRVMIEDKLHTVIQFAEAGPGNLAAYAQPDLTANTAAAALESPSFESSVQRAVSVDLSAFMPSQQLALCNTPGILGIPKPQTLYFSGTFDGLEQLLRTIQQRPPLTTHPVLFEKLYQIGCFIQQSRTPGATHFREAITLDASEARQLITLFPQALTCPPAPAPNAAIPEEIRSVSAATASMPIKGTRRVLNAAILLLSVLSLGLLPLGMLGFDVYKQRFAAKKAPSEKRPVGDWVKGLIFSVIFIAASVLTLGILPAIILYGIRTERRPGAVVVPTATGVMREGGAAPADTDSALAGPPSPHLTPRFDQTGQSTATTPAERQGDPAGACDHGP